MEPDYFLGLDLGQTTDFSALCVLERPAWRSGAGEPTYSLRHLQRFPLGTPYTAIVLSVAQLCGVAILRDRAVLTVDQTGVGRPIVEQLRKGPVPCRIVPVTITGGHSVTETDDRGFHVPKRELVTCLQLLFQGKRLKIASSLPETKLLVRELLNFRVKITAAAHEVFEASRDGDHDDLVLAVALACWQAEHDMPWFDGAISTGGRSVFDNVPDGVFNT